MPLALVAFVGCPSCPTALTARSLVLSENLLLNALYLLLPFAVVALVIHLVTRRGTR